MKDKRKRIARYSKYDLGSFVTQNREVSSNYQNQINSLETPQGGQAGNMALSGLGTGASIGTSILPGWGTAAGAILGGVGGFLFGSSQDKKAQEAYENQVNTINTQRSNITKDLYEGAIDTVNENPYGIFELGGDIPSERINIEQGEIQINANSGKILRRYKGINPETGGKYSSHNNKGEDPLDNFVTAEPGTFIITASKAKEYEDAINNNDKLHQESIKQNIRNQKKLSLDNKFATGGDIWDELTPLGVNPNLNFNIPKNLKRTNNPFPSTTSNLSNSGNLMSGLNTGLGFATGLYNMAQGNRRPRYQDFTPQRLDIESRRRILEDLPQDVSTNPAINNIRRARNRAYGSIDSTTSNPSIARANKLAMEDNFLNAENNALYNTELMNNQIRGQRSGILSSLSAQDESRTARNLQTMYGIDETNRMLALAKEQQFNTGLSQIGENIRNNQMIGNQRRNDRLRLQLLKDTNPYLENYMGNWYQNLDI